MRQVVLFIGMSLDGYIAGPDGNVDWMNGQDSTADNMDTYASFIKNVDTVIMGWNTYHQIVTELSPTEWVYKGLTCYVITHKKESSTEEIKFTKEKPCELVNALKQKDGKDIWICGGANIAGQLMRADLIDKYYFSVIPTLLGQGIRLFNTLENELKLKLIQTQSYNGITDLVYVRR